MGTTPIPAQGLRRLADRIEQAGIAVTVQVGIHPEDKQQAAALAALLVPAMLATTEPIRHTARVDGAAGFEYWDLSAHMDDCLTEITVYGPPVATPEAVA